MCLYNPISNNLRFKVKFIYDVIPHLGKELIFLENDKTRATGNCPRGGKKYLYLYLILL